MVFLGSTRGYVASSGQAFQSLGAQGSGYLRFSGVNARTKVRQAKPGMRDFQMAGTVIYEAHPAMFRAHPFWFILAVLLILAFGIGIIVLLYWYIKTRATALTVTENELMYERGILSKDRTSVSLKHVRSVHVTQGFINRILGVGTIQISTAGDEPEFTIADMPDPHLIREAITKAQEMRDNND
jgi:uncharacterized membrane protein YdbT with pleckstrin-like domain